jgi:hypothetical protein
MKLALNSEAWARIYSNLREEFYKRHHVSANREEIREFLEEYGVMIKTEPFSQRWESVEIVLEDEELTVFLLTWA